MKNTFATALAGAALFAVPAFAQEAAPASAPAPAPAPAGTSTAVDESLFSEALSMQNSVEEADKIFSEVFAGFRGDLLLEADVALREDGKPSIEWDSNTGEVTISVRLALNDEAWHVWMTNAYARFTEVSEEVLGPPVIGIGVTTRPQEGLLTIEEIVPGSPADRDNSPERLVPGDRIFAIAEEYAEFVDIRNWPPNKAIGLIRGREGTSVRLRVIPAGAPNTEKTVTLTRRIINRNDRSASGRPAAFTGEDNPQLMIGLDRFFVKKEYGPALCKRLKPILGHQWVIRVALVDKKDLTIAAAFVDTKQFGNSFGRLPLECDPYGIAYRSSGVPYSPAGYGGGGNSALFLASWPATNSVVLSELSLADLKSTAKVVCHVGELNALAAMGTEKALAYRKTHPNKKISVGGVSFELAQLSPRLLVGTTEVTQALWEIVMGENPSRFKDPDNPVESFSSTDCRKFLEKLNARPELRETGLVFRLPRPEEWVFACRAGAMGDYCKLADGTEITKDTIGEVAWYKDNSGIEKNNSGIKTHPVGQKRPNAFGLYDMCGNVSELTLRDYSLGGAYDSVSRRCESLQYWNYDSPGHDSVGFRLFASAAQN